VSEDGSVRPKRSGQRKVRKYALDLLFAADLRQTSLSKVLATYAELNQAPPPDKAIALAQGVADRVDLIDARLAAGLAPGWTIERMPTVDRNLARLACYEMMYEGVAPAVAISEAVGLAEELSTDASASFLSGALHNVGAAVMALGGGEGDGDHGIG